MQIRNAILALHRWTGLTVGLAIVFVAITGLAMVFRPQLEPVVDADLRAVSSCAERLPLDALADRARAAHPDSEIHQLEISEGGFGATIVRFQDKDGIYLDPCNGAILGERSRWSGVFNRIEWLHRWRFVVDSDVAGWIVGSIAIAFIVVMAVGGLVAWWPSTRRQWKSAAKLRWNLRGAAFEINLHRTFGAYASVFLLATTLAALTLAFDWARDLVFVAAGSPVPAPAPPASATGGTPQSFERLFRAVLASVPQARDVTLPVPSKPGRAIEVKILERDAPHANAFTLLALDPYTGAVLRAQPYAAASAGYRAYRWLTALHMGHIGGLFGQLALFFTVLSIPVLGYTGIRSFLRRQSTSLRT